MSFNVNNIIGKKKSIIYSALIFVVRLELYCHKLIDHSTRTNWPFWDLLLKNDYIRNFLSEVENLVLFIAPRWLWYPNLIEISDIFITIFLKVKDIHMLTTINQIKVLSLPLIHFCIKLQHLSFLISTNF